ncbi:hypothetical protein [Pedobacter sp. N23S346]|uniref:hypothetical protein n=1 Tax=Pedobacter sp. N23S346 TaxID=3402750 RepID=UPI003AC17BBC
MPGIQMIRIVLFTFLFSEQRTLECTNTGEYVMNNLMGGVGADIFYKNVALNAGIQKKYMGS